MATILDVEVSKKDAAFADNGVEKTNKKQQNYSKKACDGGEMNGCRSLGIINRLMAK